MEDNSTPVGEQPPRSLHHRIYPYSTELIQYATERSDDLTNPNAKPWIVRDRSTALRNERQGRGRALVRVWIPTGWEYVNTDEEYEGNQE